MGSGSALHIFLVLVYVHSKIRATAKLVLHIGLAYVCPLVMKDECDK